MSVLKLLNPKLIKKDLTVEIGMVTLKKYTDLIYLIQWKERKLNAMMFW